MLSNDSPNNPPPHPCLFHPVLTFLDFQGPSVRPCSSLYSCIPPNRAPGGAWHSKRIEYLQPATPACYPTAGMIDLGRDLDLEIHRSNYNSEGLDPKPLRVLWWESPKEPKGTFGRNS